MNNFWHFGDSFAFNDFELESKNIQENNFGHIIAKNLGMKYNFRSTSGSSNDCIFKSILKESNNFKEDDLIFINWSFFSRGTYVDVYNLNNSLDEIKEWEFDLDENVHLIKSTNHWFNEDSMSFNKFQNDFEYFIKNYSFIIDYILNYNFDYNFKLFDKIFTYLKKLEEKNIKIYNLFIRGNEKLYYDGNEILLKFKNGAGDFLNFKPSYFEWLIENKYKMEEEGHYAKGIQPILANEILKRMRIQKSNELI